MKNGQLYEVRTIKNLKDMLEQSERLFGDRNAFLLKDPHGEYKGLTYRQFKRDVDSLGTKFIDMGLKGKYIAVIGENRYEWCVTYLATVNGVGTIVPIDKELPLQEIEYMLERCGAEAVVYSGHMGKDFLGVAAKVPSLKYLINMDITETAGNVLGFRTLVAEGAALLDKYDDRYLKQEIDDSIMCALLFTSGTTGVSKGVMLSHKNLCSNMMAVTATVCIDINDSVLSILPLHHTYECTIGFLTVIYKGCTISFCEGLKHIAKNLKEVKPTLMVSVPLILENAYGKIWEQAGKKRGMKTVLKAMLAASSALYDLSGIDIRRQLFKKVHDNFGGRLRLIVSGAAAIDPEVGKGFRRFGIPVLQGYGLTECSPLVTGNRDTLWFDASIGTPIPGVEVRIDDPNEKGIGELLVKGDNVMLGYFNDEDATAKVLKDGWFHTGDLGRMDPNGFFYITGRSKNVIVTKNGKNIYPEELEAYISRSPLVSEVMVWGRHDETSGETQVNANIFPNLEAIKEKLKVGQVTKEQILSQIGEVIRSVNKGIPLYKHIKDFSVRDSEFIKTTTKKIKRFMADVERKGTVKE